MVGRRRRGVVGALITVVVVALGATALMGSVASAKSVKSKATPIEEANESMDLSGKVKSPKGACKKGRKVTVFMAPSGGRTFSFVGKTKTKKNGEWKLNAEANFAFHQDPGTFFPLGDYFVDVKKKKKGNLICKGTDSKTSEGLGTF